MVFEEDPVEISEEAYELYKKGKYVEALKEHANILKRRRGSCSIWTAENDITAAAIIAEEGNIKLPSSVYQERSMHANATWKVVDDVLKTIDKL